MKKYFFISLVTVVISCTNEVGVNLNKVGRTVKKLTDPVALLLHKGLSCRGPQEKMEYVVLDAMPGSAFFYEKGSTPDKAKAFRKGFAVVKTLCEVKIFLVPQIKRIVESKNDELKCNLGNLALIDSILRC